MPDWSDVPLLYQAQIEGRCQLQRQENKQVRIIRVFFSPFSIRIIKIINEMTEHIEQLTGPPTD